MVMSIFSSIILQYDSNVLPPDAAILVASALTAY